MDKLVKVWQKDGDEAWVLIHVEVQSQEEDTFPERMYVYNYRLFDRYRRRVASLAVLGDERIKWRPDRYEQGLWGCRMQFEFPVVKLLDYRKDWTVLEASRNPFATIVMAHLKTQETRHDAEERQMWKFRLIRRLYEQGYAKEDIIGLFRFIDWLMRLPEEAEAALWYDIQAYEEEERMDYITSVERIGIKKGFQQGEQLGEQRGLRKGLLEGISLGLELKFGSEGLRLLPEIRKIEDVDRLWTIHEGLKIVETVEALRSLYRPEDAE